MDLDSLCQSQQKWCCNSHKLFGMWSQTWVQRTISKQILFNLSWDGLKNYQRILYLSLTILGIISDEWVFTIGPNLENGASNSVIYVFRKCIEANTCRISALISEFYTITHKFLLKTVKNTMQNCFPFRSLSLDCKNISVLNRHNEVGQSGWLNLQTLEWNPICYVTLYDVLH